MLIFKFGLIFQNYYSGNLILGVNQEDQFPINLMLKDKIKNNNQSKKTCQSIKIAIKK